MSARTLVLFTSIVLSCSASIACGDDETSQPTGTGGSSGSGGGGSGGGETTCKVSVNASAPALSFKDDVMPIFGFACAGSSCHSGTRPKAGLFLGPKCDFMNGDCTWPDEPPANPSAGQPITQADIDKAHTQLMEASLTAPAVKRVTPNDPDASFLVDKIAGIQNDKGLTCTPTESSAAEIGPCGQWMPQTGGPLCGNSGSAAAQGRVDTIVNWIAQGAKND